MVDPVSHSDRSHQFWSASASDKLWECGGYLALSRRHTEGKENPAAAWGTACHQLADRCLIDGSRPSDHIGTIEKTKEHEIEVDEELAEAAATYVQYIWDRLGAYEMLDPGNSTAHFERRFNLSAIKPPFPAGGTADAVLVLPAWGLLEVIDLKGGLNLVEVVGNRQLRTYALGAFLAFGGNRVSRIRLTIVQPRADHTEGRIRHEEFDLPVLRAWTDDLLAAMNRAKTAMDLLDEHGMSHVWGDTFLKPGRHCRYCRSAAVCPSLKGYAMVHLGEQFDHEELPWRPPAPAEMSPKQLKRILDAKEAIEAWLKAVTEHAQDRVEAGDNIEGWVLSPSRPMRRWKTDEDEKLLAELSQATGLPPDQLVSKKPLSPAQLEKVLGKARSASLDGLWVSHSSGVKLAKAKPGVRTIHDRAKNFFAG